jgi:hypothetical protein
MVKSLLGEFAKISAKSMFGILQSMEKIDLWICQICRHFHSQTRACAVLLTDIETS